VQRLAEKRIRPSMATFMSFRFSPAPNASAPELRVQRGGSPDGRRLLAGRSAVHLVPHRRATTWNLEVDGRGAPGRACRPLNAATHRAGVRPSPNACRATRSARVPAAAFAVERRWSLPAVKRTALRTVARALRRNDSGRERTRDLEGFDVSGAGLVPVQPLNRSHTVSLHARETLATPGFGAWMLGPCTGS
jgi:hypothetical protein